MLRCCKLLLRLRNNHGSQNLSPSLDVTVRSVHNASKSRLRDSALGTRVRQIVYFSSLDPPFAQESIPFDDQIETEVDIDSLRADGKISLFVRKTQVSQSPLSNSGGPQFHVVPGTRSISCQSEELAQHDVYSPGPTGNTLDQNLSADSQSSVAVQDLSNAVTLLRGLISKTTSLPTESVVATVKSLIHSFGSKLVRSLDAGQSNELLCILGTISDDGSGQIYHYTCKINGRGWSGLDIDGCWEEVVRIAKVKEQLGHVLGDRENFWLMRAYLRRLQLVDSPDQQMMAHTNYSRISRTSSNGWTVSTPYLDTFLALPLSTEFFNALDILLGTFAKHANRDQAVAKLLWKVILRRGHELPPICKSRILGLLRHRRLSPSEQDYVPFGLGDIVTALAASFFPCLTFLAVPANISAWIGDCARTSLAEEISVDERFNNLILIAMWLMPEELPTSLLSGTTPQSYEWRAIIGLAVLDRLFYQKTKSKDLQDLIRVFWRCWKKNVLVPRPQQVDRLVLSKFFQAAGYLEDAKLFNACINYASLHRLWISSMDDESETCQLEQLYSSFTTGILALKGQFRAELLSLLADTSLSLSQRTRCIHVVFQKLVDHDIEFARQFHSDCLSQGISIPSEASLPLVRQLVFLQRWDDVVAFLRTCRLSSVLLEQLLETILSVFRYTRQELTIPVVAKAVGDVLLRLYSTGPIPGRLKYPIRFFLPIMITSHHPELAIQLLEKFTRNNPVMYTARFYLRIIQTLLNHRRPELALDVLRLAANLLRMSSGALEALRRKTFRGLVHIGAHGLAFKVVFMHPARQQVRDRLVRLYARRPSHSVKLALFRLLPSLYSPSASSSMVLSAVQVLVRNRHLGLARKFIQRSCKRLKSEDLTTICNVYLHGPLRYWNMRGGRLVRHVLKTKDFLEQRYGFVPDRATVNIVIKAMLRWRSFMDSRKVRSLFDHLIRNGYPASEQWNAVYGVPFGTSPGGVTLSLTNIRQSMSFKRHVRPLYKMFIKELFLRKDSWAGRRVVGILKETEILAMERKAHREQVRRRGIEKKKQRQRAMGRNQ